MKPSGTEDVALALTVYQSVGQGVRMAGCMIKYWNTYMYAINGVLCSLKGSRGLRIRLMYFPTRGVSSSTAVVSLHHERSHEPRNYMVVL